MSSDVKQQTEQCGESLHVFFTSIQKPQMLIFAFRRNREEREDSFLEGLKPATVLETCFLIPFYR